MRWCSWCSPRNCHISADVKLDAHLCQLENYMSGVEIGPERSDESIASGNTIPLKRPGLPCGSIMMGSNKKGGI